MFSFSNNENACALILKNKRHKKKKMYYIDYGNNIRAVSTIQYISVGYIYSCCIIEIWIIGYIRHAILFFLRIVE